MSLYPINRRVWCEGLQTLATIQEARYVTYGGRRKAEYVIQPISESPVFVDGAPTYPPIGPDFMCSPSALRAADWGCDGCDRWLPGRPHRTAPDGEYPDGLQFCFLCSDERVISRVQDGVW